MVVYVQGLNDRDGCDTVVCAMKTALEFTVGPGGWLQARVLGTSGLESVVAVRLRPDPEGNWQPDGTLLVQPMTQETLRKLPLRRILLAVAASPGLREGLMARLDQEVPELGSDEFKQTVLSGYVHPELQPLKRPKGRNLSDEFYATVAERYRDAAARGLSPRTAISEAASVSTDVAGRWVREARKRGLLPPTTPGKVNV
jgi:hypothetical protein